MERLLNKKTAFHVHTKYSYDSILSPENVIDYLVYIGYGQVIITDHDNIDGALFANEYANRKYSDRFQVIIGEEISTNIGDIIGFPLQEQIKANNYKDCFRKIKEQNAYICLPHPYKQHDLFEIHIPSFIDCIDFVETFNSRLTPALNSYAEKYADYFNKKKIFGSDAHLANELNNAGFLFTSSNFDIEIIKNKYSNNKNIRRSQSIKYLKKKQYLKTIKYFILEKLNK